MVQRNRNAEHIMLVIVKSFSNEMSIVQNIVMRKGCSFRISCRSWSKLDVNRIFRLSDLFSQKQLFCISSSRHFIKLRKVDHSIFLSIRTQNDIFKIWKSMTHDMRRFMFTDLRNDFSNNLDVITLFKTLGHDQRFDLNLVQAVSKLICLESWIDIDEYQIRSKASIGCQ